MTRGCPAGDDGALNCLPADGRTLSGHVLVTDQRVGPGDERETLVVFHGAGTLSGFWTLPPASSLTSSMALAIDTITTSCGSRSWAMPSMSSPTSVCRP
jgi:hypothetical protein